MNPRYLPVVDIISAFVTMIGTPALVATIVYFAWQGKPARFDRERYGFTAASAFIAIIVLTVPAQKLRMADVRTPLFFAEIACFYVLFLLCGVFGGCLLSVFVYKKGDSLVERFLQGRKRG